MTCIRQAARSQDTGRTVDGFTAQGRQTEEVPKRQRLPPFSFVCRSGMLMRMDEVEKFKAFLGSTADGYSEAHLRQLHREMDAMAELLLDIYSWKKSQNRRRCAPDSHSGEMPPPFDNEGHHA
jgi:hypothetical protein